MSSSLPMHLSSALGKVFFTAWSGTGAIQKRRFPAAVRMPAGPLPGLDERRLAPVPTRSWPAPPYWEGSAPVPEPTI